MKFLLVAALLMSFSSAVLGAESWQEKGNGGDVIVCLNPQDNKMYDAYEAEIRHQLRLDFPSALHIKQPAAYTGFEDLAPLLHMARTVIERIRWHDPELLKVLINILGRFPKEVRFVADSDLVDIEDFGMGFIPKNCELKQLIIQRTPRFPSDRRYTIALDYWRGLTAHQKMVGIVHEVLYHYALSLNPKTQTSEPIRYLNALLLSSSIRKMNTRQYSELKREIFIWNE